MRPLCLRDEVSTYPISDPGSGPLLVDFGILATPTVDSNLDVQAVRETELEVISIEDSPSSLHRSDMSATPQTEPIVPLGTDRFTKIQLRQKKM